jgi:hypothetical protein
MITFAQKRTAGDNPPPYRKLIISYIRPLFRGKCYYKPRPVGEVAPLGDGEGQKNVKFHYFFGQSRTPVPTGLWEYFGRAHKITLSIVGVGALDDPKSYQLLQYNRRACYVR